MKQKTFVLAPDSFKESMSAKEACVAMEKGLKKAFPDAAFLHVPMADGGEGTMQSLIDGAGGEIFAQTVCGPLAKPVRAFYGLMGGDIGVIEMASASGIQLVSPSERNPFITTTYGVGELIKACLDRGVKKIILGIGGSATNDGGAGMASALGARFLGQNGELLPHGGGALDKLVSVDLSGLDKRLEAVEILVACDVTNPLCGENGASRIFGPQKGASPAMVAQLDKNLAHYAAIIERQLHRPIAKKAGAGAAGGLGAGLIAFTNSTLQKGIDIVIQYSKLPEKLKGADYCLTGEGRMDSQTLFGKTPQGVAKTAKAQNVPVIAVCGALGEGATPLYQEGIDAIFTLAPGADCIEHLLKTGAENMERVCENIGRLIKVAQKSAPS